MKIRIAALVAVAVLVIALALRPTAVVVDLAEVVQDSLSVTVPAEGRTRARDQYRLTAPNTGRITRIETESGDSVAPGERIALLYPLRENPQTIVQIRSELRALEARHVEAQGYRTEAELAADQAEREAERRRPLAASGIITPERAEQAEMAARAAAERLGSANAAVEAARAGVEAARARLVAAESAESGATPVPITAPVAGRIIEVPDRSARVVGAGEPLLAIGTTSEIEIELEVLSEDAVRVETGSKVLLTRWGGPHPLPGRVRHVTRVGQTHISTLGIEEQRVPVYAVLDQAPPSLGVGYRVSGEITVWRASDVLVVPAGSWFLDEEGPKVFVVEGGRARLQAIELGERNDRVSEVLSGLSAGASVVVHPPDALTDGARVRVRNEP